MTSLPSLYLRSAVLLGLAGISLGIVMGMQHDFRLAHFHAHLNLLGFVGFFLAGVFYVLVPAASHGPLPRLQYVLTMTGLVLLLGGLYGIAMDAVPVPQVLAASGSLLILAGFLVFVWVVFRARIG
jgi:hypothetical protein